MTPILAGLNPCLELKFEKRSLHDLSVLQIVWLAIPGFQNYLPLHIILLLRLARMMRVTQFVRVRLMLHLTAASRVIKGCRLRAAG